MRQPGIVSGCELFFWTSPIFIGINIQFSQIMILSLIYARLRLSKSIKITTNIETVMLSKSVSRERVGTKMAKDDGGWLGLT